MSRPNFLNVGFDQNGQLIPLNYEHVSNTLDNVKFVKDWGTLTVSDVRIVWYKKKSMGKKILKGALVAAAIGAAAIAAGAAGQAIGRGAGDLSGQLIRRAITGAGAAIGTGMLLSAMTGKDFINTDKDGKLESVAIPLASVKDIISDNKGFTIILESSDTMRFEVKDTKFLPVIKATVKAKKDEGKCPYCGAVIRPGNTSCQSCGAPVRGSMASLGSVKTPSAGISQIGVQGPATQTTKCPSCGKQVPLAKFCFECGSPLMQG
ncbi:MAG: zinc ribbon domain-containing protein [Candidatus Jordarchaeaceae archaeon]